MRYFVIIIAVLVCLSSRSQKVKQAQQQDEEISFTCILPEPAAFTGGIDSLHRFINDQFIQPDAVPDSSFSKKGIVKFVIDSAGKAIQFEIIDSAGYNCDEEIIRILKLTKWKPAHFEGKMYNEFERLPYTILFEKSEPVNSNTSPRSEPACPPQMPSVISE